METPLITNDEKKIGDTANTVQVSRCNSVENISNSKAGSANGLEPAMITLIDILARQAAREICGTNEGEQS